MEVISLATGGGLLDWALRDAGIKIRLQCESEKFQTRLLEENFPEPDTIRHPNIFELNKKWMEDNGLEPSKMSFVGGLCCQPFSYAGPRKGADSATWMVEQLFRLTRDCRPRLVLVENVYGFISHVDGFDRLSTRMESLNYTRGAICIPASAFGAPHERQRVFVLFSRDHFLPNSLSVRWDYRRISPPKIILPVLPGIWNGRRISEPGIPRVAYGHPTTADIKRLECAGNAVVRPVGYYVGKHFKAIHDYFYEGEGTKLLRPIQ